MAAVAFPSCLPCPLLAPYGYRPQSALERTEMEGGLPRVRRRFRQVPTIFRLEWDVRSDLNLAVFEAWFEHDLAAGANWFDIGLAVGTGRAVVHEARFVGEWEAGTAETGWRVSGEVEVRERDVLSQADGQALCELLAAYGTDDALKEVTDRLHVFVHEDTQSGLGELTWGIPYPDVEH